jgi:hypothetical protein
MALTAQFDGPLHVPVGFTLRYVAALVSSLLASGKGELDLGPPVLEVELGRDERQALLGDLAREGIDLFPVEEELAIAIRIMVGEIALVVDRDVGADQPGLASPHIRVGLLQGSAAVPEGFHLCAGQHDARLDALEEVVVVPGSSIVDDQILALWGHEASLGTLWTVLITIYNRYGLRGLFAAEED